MNSQILSKSMRSSMLSMSQSLQTESISPLNDKNQRMSITLVMNNSKRLG